VAGVLEALLATEMLPVTLPAAVGANFALSVAVWPADRVTGVERPLILKPAPVTVGCCEMVTLPVPEFVRVTVCVLLLPTVTFPKLMLVGLAVSWVVVVVPVPESDTVVGEVGALLVTTMLPVALPAVVGANFRVKVVLWPGATVRGRETPLKVKADPVTVT
jgi:hypothetical protein